MGEELLSKDELDALMDGVRSGEVDTAAAAAPGEVRVHDFARPARAAQPRLPALDAVQERAARHLRDHFHRLLRRRVEVEPAAIETLAFADVQAALAPAASVHVLKMHPLRGTALLSIDASVVSTFVDLFFGGAGRSKPDAAARELSVGEQRTVQVAVRESLAAFAAAWAPLAALAFEPAGAGLPFANAFAEDEAIVLARLRVRLEDSAGEVRLGVPVAALEPLRAVLEGRPKSEPAARGERDERWSGTLREDVLDAEVELASNLVETRIRIGDFLKLRPGDVIPIDLPEFVTLAAGEVPLFVARFGTAGGNNAVRVVEAVGRRAHLLSASKESP